MQGGGVVVLEKGMSEDAMAKMRADMEEEIRQQLMQNQAQLDSQQSGGQSWEDQVCIPIVIA